MTTLNQALTNFIQVYHTQETLVAEQHQWNCTIALMATDTLETITLQIKEGRVVNLFDALTEVDLLISAESTVLYDILEFRRDPNEPYLFGELTVQGPEAHFLRLDYIVTKLCP
jgi:putative sterol carrier protein